MHRASSLGQTQLSWAKQRTEMSLFSERTIHCSFHSAVLQFLALAACSVTVSQVAADSGSEIPAVPACTCLPSGRGRARDDVIEDIWHNPLSMLASYMEGNMLELYRSKKADTVQLFGAKGTCENCHVYTKLTQTSGHQEYQTTPEDAELILRHVHGHEHKCAFSGQITTYSIQVKPVSGLPPEETKRRIA